MRIQANFEIFSIKNKSEQNLPDTELSCHFAGLVC